MTQRPRFTQAFALVLLALLVPSGVRAASASLHGAAQAPAVCGASASGESNVGAPPPIFLTSCSTWVDCICSSGGDYLISCTGTSYCNHGVSGGGWVECDGVRTFCPPKMSC
jgi:hypothetical protein